MYGNGLRERGVRREAGMGPKGNGESLASPGCLLSVQVGLAGGSGWRTGRPPIGRLDMWLVRGRPAPLL